MKFHILELLNGLVHEQLVIDKLRGVARISDLHEVTSFTP